MIYEIKEDKLLESSKNLNTKSKGLICVFSKEEWSKYNLILNEKTERIHFCKIEDAKKYMYGTLCIPIKDKYSLAHHFSFYFYQSNLIFIGEKEYVLEIINNIINMKSKSEYDILKVFHDLLEFIIKDDLEYLEKLENKLSVIENDVTLNKEIDFNKTLIKIKKEILRYYHYYNQLLDMTDTLVDSYIIADDIFKVFNERVARLQSETLLLREYTKELQDLYESQISLRQNDIMKILTIVTTIFMPLTVITGWYGMNFKYMPELYWRLGYPLLFIIFAIIIIICLIIFKKKKFW